MKTKIEYNKIDSSINGNIQECKTNKPTFPLRLDSKTVIYVTKDKLNSEYAERKRALLGIKKANDNYPSPQKKKRDRVSIDVEKVRGLVQQGIFLKDIAREVGVSKTTIDNYIRKYNLRKSCKSTSPRI